MPHPFSFATQRRNSSSMGQVSKSHNVVRFIASLAIHSSPFSITFHYFGASALLFPISPSTSSNIYGRNGAKCGICNWRKTSNPILGLGARREYRIASYQQMEFPGATKRHLP